LAGTHPRSVEKVAGEIWNSLEPQTEVALHTASLVGVAGTVWYELRTSQKVTPAHSRSVVAVGAVDWN